jgi:hypothetical protein
MMAHDQDHAKAATKCVATTTSSKHAAMTSQEMEECITGCLACHAICLQTVEHCLEKGGAHAAQEHIRLLLDCAEFCEASAHFMIRQSPFQGRICALCAEACRACEAACRRFGDVADLQCAESCGRCAEMQHHIA